MDENVECMNLIEGETAKVTENGLGCACQEDNCNSQRLLDSSKSISIAEFTAIIALFAVNESVENAAGNSAEASPRKAAEEKEEESENSGKNFASAFFVHAEFLLVMVGGVIIYFT